MITRPRVTCADGFSVSVQAGRFFYSRPRRDGARYAAVELGYPSAAEDSLMEFCENPDAPTDTVYGYVPVDVVKALVEKHGGCGDQLDWLFKADAEDESNG
jgi:hypothetical protein